MAADTIFALASGAGRAAVAVIRISGPAALETLAAFTGLRPRPRTAHYARYRDPETHETIDRGLALSFPAPASATGEDCAEFHLHGGRAVLAAILASLGRRPGLRAAQPGEFARRAFLNGKMDLSQVEALADLIDAQTAFQRRQALRIAGGELRRPVEAWRAALIEAMALLAAELDFSDEGDVGVFSASALDAVLAPVIAQIEMALRIAPASERLREGFVVLILGPPNAGKSSLLNYLARREAAIVSEIPGTTRDLIEVDLDLAGAPITLIDTAGLRESGDAIERMGVARARARAGEADLILWLSEGGATAPPSDLGAQVEVLHVATKCDAALLAGGALATSVTTGAGLDALCKEIARRALRSLGDGGSALVIRERHRLAVTEALASLRAAREAGKPLELVAEDLRLAARALGRITGAIDVEQVLDVIFSRLCIGK
ncbi:MAG TPA: tRNA uridine-5-carboxymethylaminomethyl(34) synthesis GTPase MnmE [Methylocystis sp.]|nr:tRNA uridine-5-carboxymethylaminomethyl(34) synthesis GTPase MnmE [Methylocystis sp.]